MSLTKEDRQFINKGFGAMNKKLGTESSKLKVELIQEVSSRMEWLARATQKQFMVVHKEIAELRMQITKKEQIKN